MENQDIMTDPTTGLTVDYSHFTKEAFEQSQNDLKENLTFYQWGAREYGDTSQNPYEDCAIKVKDALEHSFYVWPANYDGKIRFHIIDQSSEESEAEAETMTPEDYTKSSYEEFPKTFLEQELPALAIQKKIPLSITPVLRQHPADHKKAVDENTLDKLLDAGTWELDEAAVKANLMNKDQIFQHENATLGHVYYGDSCFEIQSFQTGYGKNNIYLQEFTEPYTGGINPEAFFQENPDKDRVKAAIRTLKGAMDIFPMQGTPSMISLKRAITERLVETGCIDSYRMPFYRDKKREGGGFYQKCENILQPKEPKRSFAEMGLMKQTTYLCDKLQNAFDRLHVDATVVPYRGVPMYEIRSIQEYSEMPKYAYSASTNMSLKDVQSSLSHLARTSTGEGKDFYYPVSLAVKAVQEIEEQGKDADLAFAEVSENYLDTPKRQCEMACKAFLKEMQEKGFSGKEVQRTIRKLVNQPEVQHEAFR